MANPTTNFGWVMPTSTDLVTDLPADFAIFGQAVDTSMAELKGGTTGQVLSKTSNTDMDFTWVAQDDSNAIQNAIVDAKGDLIAATAADTPARLAVGTNGQVLTADSTTATGLKWAASAAGGKVLQVVNAVYGTSTTISSTSFTDTGLTATITPTSATSKILVLISQPVEMGRNGVRAYTGWQYLRGGTVLNTGSAVAGVYTSGADSVLRLILTATYLDSPATTSAVTYKTQGQWYEATSSPVLVFQAELDSTITLMEIGA